MEALREGCRVRREEHARAHGRRQPFVRVHGDAVGQFRPSQQRTQRVERASGRRARRRPLRGRGRSWCARRRTRRTSDGSRLWPARAATAHGARQTGSGSRSPVCLLTGIGVRIVLHGEDPCREALERVVVDQRDALFAVHEHEQGVARLKRLFLPYARAASAPSARPVFCRIRGAMVVPEGRAQPCDPAPEPDGCSGNSGGGGPAGTQQKGHPIKQGQKVLAGHYALMIAGELGLSIQAPAGARPEPTPPARVHARP